MGFQVHALRKKYPSLDIEVSSSHQFQLCYNFYLGSSFFSVMALEINVYHVYTTYHRLLFQVETYS